MEPSLKTRLLGAAVLIALAVLFLPMMFPSTPPKTDADQTVSLAIPPAPDRELQTRTLDVAPGTGRTSLPGVFAAGDIVRGASLAVWAVRQGQDAAAAIHTYLSRMRQAA